MDILTCPLSDSHIRISKVVHIKHLCLIRLKSFSDKSAEADEKIVKLQDDNSLLNAKVKEVRPRLNIVEFNTCRP